MKFKDLSKGAFFVSNIFFQPILFANGGDRSKALEVCKEYKLQKKDDKTAMSVHLEPIDIQEDLAVIALE